MEIVDRFLKYVSFCTTSDENTGLTPSTPGQIEFAKYLAEELKSIGLSEVRLDENGYIMATLESNQPSDRSCQIPVVGFIAHMDTSPDASGKHVKASIVKAEEREYIDPRYAGQDVIVTDETTLLGADDLLSALLFKVQLLRQAGHGQHVHHLRPDIAHRHLPVHLLMRGDNLPHPCGRGVFQVLQIQNQMLCLRCQFSERFFKIRCALRIHPSVQA